MKKSNVVKGLVATTLVMGLMAGVGSVNASAASSDMTGGDYNGGTGGQGSGSVGEGGGVWEDHFMGLPMEQEILVGHIERKKQQSGLVRPCLLLY